MIIYIYTLKRIILKLVLVEASKEEGMWKSLSSAATVAATAIVSASAARAYCHISSPKKPNITEHRRPKNFDAAVQLQNGELYKGLLVLTIGS